MIPRARRVRPSPRNALEADGEIEDLRIGEMLSEANEEGVVDTQMIDGEPLGYSMANCSWGVKSASSPATPT